jgi:Mn-containing catalase
MNIATEEFSHLEIVGATIQMLLTGVKGISRTEKPVQSANKKLSAERKAVVDKVPPQ